MESKTFYNVFNNVKLNNEYADIFNNVSVDKVTANRARTNYKVYITSQRIIPRDVLDEVEKAIERDYFGRSETQVLIIERFELSSLYTPEIVFKEYKDSIRYIFSRGGSMDTAFFDSLEFEIEIVILS